MHGTFNDFVVLDARNRRIDDVAEFAAFVCNRRAAIGADGLLLIEPSAAADVRMRIINADGSEAEMCGNGARCIARYLAEAGEGDVLRVETLVGAIDARVVARDPEFLVRIGIGKPAFVRRTLPFADAQFVSLGNPHVVVFDPSPDAFDLPAAAARLAALPAYEGGVNVHVAAADGPALRVRHFERGVGLTMSCGSGAVAAATAAIRSGLLRSPVDVYVPGGHLVVEWDGEGEAFLTGPAVRVFDTEL